MLQAPFPEDCALHFRPIRMLARGGYGAVFLAEQIQLGRPAAVKLLDVALQADSVQEARFLREARLTAQLKHPNVVAVLDHGLGAGVPWIAYEYLDGGTLRSKLDAGAVPLSDVVEIIRQVADALEAAHSVGVVHRDVKPENVLIAGPGQYKLTDFGIASSASSTSIATATGVVLGTPLYLAPELVEGAEASTASDVYALAVLAFTLITGREPFDAENLPAILDQHRCAPVPSVRAALPGAPGALDAVLTRGMAKLPSDRPAAPTRFAAELERVIAGEPAASEKTLYRERSSRPTTAPRSAGARYPAAHAAGRPAGGLTRRRGVQALAMAVAVASVVLVARSPWRQPVHPSTPSPASVSPTPGPPSQKPVAPRPESDWDAVFAAVTLALIPTDRVSEAILHKKYEKFDLEVRMEPPDLTQETKATSESMRAMASVVRGARGLKGRRWLSLEAAACEPVSIAQRIARMRRNAELAPVLDHGKAARNLIGAFEHARTDEWSTLAAQLIDFDVHALLDEQAPRIDLSRARARLNAMCTSLKSAKITNTTSLTLDEISTLGDCWHRIAERARELVDLKEPDSLKRLLEVRVIVCTLARNVLEHAPDWSQQPHYYPRIVEALEACCDALDRYPDPSLVARHAPALVKAMRAVRPPRMREHVEELLQKLAQAGVK